MVRKILNITVLSVLLIAELYFVAAPAVMDAATSASDEIIAYLIVTGETTISSPANITLKPDIPGITGSGGIPSSASATWTVVTNNETGFNLSIYYTPIQGGIPAMALGTASDQYFTDYTPAASGTADYAWGQPASGEAEFGFSVGAGTAADAASTFKNDGVDTCGTGANNSTGYCFLNLVPTPSSTTIVNRSTYTGSGGENETVKFWAESNAKFLKSGTYSATMTLTAAIN